MTTQNFPNCSNPNNSIFAWALRADAEDVAEAIVFSITASEESRIQLQALLAMAEA